MRISILIIPTIAILLLTSQKSAIAQEIRATVNISTPKLQKADPQVFETLKRSMEEFFNNTAWTDDEFQEDERIEVQIQMTITEEESDTRFKADLIMQSSRPVYNSNVNTVVFTHLDRDVRFDYQQYQPLIFSQNAYNDNLTSILSFYAYLIIGMDYDTFSPFGGEPFFLLAQQIMNAVPTNEAAQFRGWMARDGNRNRYWLMENLLNPRIRPLRQVMYDYHRLGLDLMYKDPETSRATMAASLQLLDNVMRNYPNAMMLQAFANAKRDEVIEIFKNGEKAEKGQVKNTMIRIDPANAATYQRIGF
ncbi:MAG: DUF4835 family protein [Saprospiraceae bacterium]